MDIARYSIKNPVNVWLLVLVFLIGGAVALNNIGRLEDPAFTIKQVQVVTQFPGASAQKVLEDVMLKMVNHIHSKTKMKTVQLTRLLRF